jgi:hypothetical protein
LEILIADVAVFLSFIPQYYKKILQFQIISFSLHYEQIGINYIFGNGINTIAMKGTAEIKKDIYLRRMEQHDRSVTEANAILVRNQERQRADILDAFKRDAKRLALETASSHKVFGPCVSDQVLKDADHYYEWLIKDAK